MKKKLAYVVLFLVAALFPALGACYERAVCCSRIWCARQAFKGRLSGRS